MIQSQNTESENQGIDKLLWAVSNMQVPETVSKEEAWNRISQKIKQQEQSERFRIRLMHWGAAAIVLIAVISGILEWQLATVTIKAPNGKMAYGLLPDSTMVSLNANTIIKHRKYGFISNREVEIWGEALFEVKRAKNTFRVIAGNSSIDALGTRFNVFFRNEKLRVECLSGEVMVKKDAIFEKTLNHGNGMAIDPNSSQPQLFSLDYRQAASWIRGEFFYTNAMLSEVFDEVERQFELRINVTGFDPNQRFYSGYFKNDSPYEALSLICLPMNLLFEIDKTSGKVKISPN
jgi:ferric-dicitrate binding protein FerR (iron transport regulator)